MKNIHNKKNTAKNHTFDVNLFFKLLIVRFLGVFSKLKRINNKGDSNTVIIIKRDGLGDFFLFLDAAKQLRKFYYDKKIVFIGNPAVKEIAESLGYFDEFCCFENKDLYIKNLLKTYKKISSYKCDILLHPTQPRSVEAEIIAYWINAKTKIASKGEMGNLTVKLKRMFDRNYDRLVDCGIHNMTLIQSANFVRGVGATDYTASLPSIDKIPSSNICVPKEYFLIFLGGSAYNKLWPADRYAAVASHIFQKTGWNCVVGGTNADLEQQKVFEFANVKFYSLIGKTSLIDLLYVVSKAKLVVGNDTVAIHMANAVKVPSVCVKGQFSGTKFFPYIVENKKENEVYPIAVCKDVNCRWCTLRNGGYFCLNGEYYARKTAKCLDRVSIEDVINAIDIILDGFKK